ncbi:ankyrin repeat domain-containing protein [Thalassobius sp. Cn5-15]|uniref:ankyrin repeat domain-containing protein n=1 Tax=Thalassobius sp. Cn5-15 TaxID=2917763 RepID=UPI001EF2CAAC|nr:ankyrin repeat domain-containing protein [Thalassobius sp. Cn5-15]MCG7493866.1 ankyrin repeat domain-containing protein [Thalassobius sp. Cn5-15]
MTHLSLDKLRRAAKRLRRDHQAGDARALERLRIHPPRSDAGTDTRVLQHADYLHVIAREQNFNSWPVLKLAAETMGLDRAARQQRLKLALANGQGAVVQHLLAQTPDLVDGLLGCAIALYDVEVVRAALAADPTAAVAPLGPRSPMVHLCFSKMIHVWPDRKAAMLEIAQLLIDNGADVNDALAGPDGHGLSVLYGALGHANNMVLAQWLLDHGADPNDGESLYHATELGHTRGIEMLLRAGADPKGTNALLRALDFNDHVAVRLLLAAGADVNEFTADPVGGDMPWVIPTLHQAARRMCDAEMVDLLLSAGADPSVRYQGANAYGYAKVFGNEALALAIEAHGTPQLSAVEKVLAAAVEGHVAGVRLDPAALPEAYQNLLHAIIPLDRGRDHLRTLLALGLPIDGVDGQSLTPLQIAAWEGIPDVMALFIECGADLTHVNGYGGTLLSTIVHGAEHCPARGARDHIACLELALAQGIDLPRQALEWPGQLAVTEFLRDWAEEHPQQVVEGGLA